jgi:O-antigen ligase
MTVEIAAPAPGPQQPIRPSFGWLRRRTDIGLSLAMGAIVAFLIATMPMEAALASSVIGAFVLLALVDTRVAVLALLLVRATLDVTSTVPLLSTAGASSVNANALTSLLVIALGSAHIAINRVRLRQVPLFTPFALFVVITFLGIAWAPDKNLAAQDWLRGFGTLILYVLIVDLMRTSADRRWVVRVILLSAVVPLLVGLYQLFTDTGNHDTPGFNRIFGTLAHPSPYAFYILQLLPLAIVFLIYTRNRIGRLGLFAMIPIMLFTIYATQTRGAWIGVLVMAMVVMWLRARWTLIFVPLILGAAFFALPSVRQRVSGINSGECVSETDCKSSVLWRQKQWEAALRSASPLKVATVGAGLRDVDVTLGQFTHNEYVRLLIETGVLGLAATVVLYKQLFDITVQGHRDATDPYQRDLMLAFLVVLVSRFVFAASDNILVLVVLEWYFWAFAAIIVVESGAYDRKRLARVAGESKRGVIPGRPAIAAPAGAE